MFRYFGASGNIRGNGDADLDISLMSESEFFGVALLVAVGAIAYALGARDKFSDTHRGEVIFTHTLPTRQFPLKGSCSVELLRQSGATYRHLGTFSTFEGAMAEPVRSFNRAKIDEGRITHDDETSLVVYRKKYSLSGRAQGKEMAGAIFRAEKFEHDGQGQKTVPEVRPAYCQREAQFRVSRRP